MFARIAEPLLEQASNRFSCIMWRNAGIDETLCKAMLGSFSECLEAHFAEFYETL